MIMIIDLPLAYNCCANFKSLPPSLSWTNNDDLIGHLFGFNRPSKSCECKDECDSIIGPLNEIKIICGVFVVGVSPGVDDV